MNTARFTAALVIACYVGFDAGSAAAEFIGQADPPSKPAQPKTQDEPVPPPPPPPLPETPPDPNAKPPPELVPNPLPPPGQLPEPAPERLPTPAENLRNIPRNPYLTRPGVGLPQRQLFRDTRAGYYNSLRNVTFDPTFVPLDSPAVTGDLDLPDFRGDFPLLQRGFAPEEADLKLGPLYFKIRQFSASVLFSDNIDHTETDRQSDWIGVTSIGAQVMAQFTEGFQFALAGNYVYFPSEGEGGFSGFGLRAPFSFGIGSAPTTSAQLVWEPVLFGTPIQIADNFRIGLARFSNSAYDGFSAFGGSDLDAAARSGIYTFRGPTTAAGDVRDTNDSEFLYFSNTVSLTTGGALPGQNAYYFRASHEDLWYDDNEQTETLPTIRDRFIFNVDSVRDTLRFKPYARYEFLHQDQPDRDDHTIRFGVRGPITDLLSVRAEAGHLYQAKQDQTRFIWRTGIYHQPSPFTQHSLEYFRDATDFHEELDEQVIYRLTKVLGPSITGSAYTSYHWIEDLEGVIPDRKEWRNALRLSYLYTPRTTFRGVLEVGTIDYDEGGNTDYWRGRIEVSHRFYDRMVGRLIYQYQSNDTDTGFRSYDENLCYLSLSWIFQ